MSFEEAVFHIMAGDVLDTIEHPNQKRYPGQQIHVLAIEDYVYLVPFVETELVPFVETEDEVFLKTIIPSCKEPLIESSRIAFESPKASIQGAGHSARANSITRPESSPVTP